MKRTVLTIACIAVLASGCDTSDSGTPDTKPSAKLATTISTDGVYEVGKDVRPGVYTTKGQCIGYSAKTSDFDIMNDDDESDAYIAGALPVGGDVQRIELHKGEFFTSKDCSTWTREDGTKPTTADPGTLAGACDILVGEGRAVQDALGFPRKHESSADEKLRGEIQDRLFIVVAADNKDLADPAGQLVDFLDDPEAYVEDGKLDSLILNAFSDIRDTCQATAD
jgi:hypothetical protein